MRFVWIGVIALTVLVPAVLIPSGYAYDAHTSSTVGGPITIFFCIVIAVGFDVLLWLGFALFLVARSARKAAGELRQDDPSASI
jgi:hypothetical protein